MAIDWRAGMARTYELVRVDADKWDEHELVQHLSSCDITYEGEGLRYSASMETYDRLADSYYRVYLLARQGMESARVPLATLRVQTPRTEMDGRSAQYRADGYSPLVELDSDYPPVAWTAQGTVVQVARGIVEGHCPAPCSHPDDRSTMEPWTADDGDTWLDCLEAVLAKAGMHVEVDGMGTILFVHDDDPLSLGPVWSFDDAAYDLPSIMMPDVSDVSDWYDVKNKVEVIYSDASQCIVGTATNDDPLSPTSTISRGYVSTMRETSPEVDEPVTQAKLDALARKILSEQVAGGTATLRHAFVPGVGPHRCVRIDYTRMGYRVDGTVSRVTLPCLPDAICETTIDYRRTP